MTLQIVDFRLQIGLQIGLQIDCSLNPSLKSDNESAICNLKSAIPWRS